MRSSIFRLAVLAVVFSVPAWARAEPPPATWTLAPRDTSRLERLLEPPQGIALGWRFVSLLMRPNAIEATFTATDGHATETLVLSRPSQAQGTPVSHGLSLQPGNDSVAIARLRSAVAAALAKQQDDWTWVSGAVEPAPQSSILASMPAAPMIARPMSAETSGDPVRSEERSSLPGAGVLLLLALFAAAAVTWFSSTATALRSLARECPPPRWALPGLAGVTALGGIIRFVVSPRTFLHEGFQIAQDVQFALFNDNLGELSGRVTGPLIYRLAHAVLGGGERALFSTNLLLATLTIPAVALLDLAIFRAWPRALFAGLLFALLPVHVRWSASEDLSIPGVFFATWALTALASYVTTRTTIALVTCIAALAAAVQVSGDLSALPAVFVLFVLCAMPRSDWTTLVAPRALSCLGLFGLLLSPRIVFAVLHKSPDLLTTVTNARTALPDPALTPVVLWLLLAAGAAWAARSNQKGYAAWTIVAALGYAFHAVASQASRPGQQRLQLVSMPWLMVLCAGALPALLAVSGRSRSVRALAACALGLVPLAGLAARVPAIRQLSDQQQEWLFLREAVPELPKDASQLLALATPTSEAVDAFPAFLLSQHPQKLGVIDIVEAAKTMKWPAPDSGLLYYEGVYCRLLPNVVELPPGPGDKRDFCEEVHKRYRLKPVTTQLLLGPSYTPLVAWPAPYNVGFYELSALE